MNTKPKLYHYVHCPYCVRVRLVLGHLGIEFESVVLPYDDEATPIELMGKKMLPIYQSSELTSNESLDIIRFLDKNQRLGASKADELEQFNQYLSEIGQSIHSLTMPYWIYTPEFTDASRTYFLAKKEHKRGPFKDLVARRAEFEASVNESLKEIAQNLKPFYQSEHLTLRDIMLASHLWGLYVVPEFQFEAKLHDYLQRVKQLCHFDYHCDFWN